MSELERQSEVRLIERDAASRVMSLLANREEIGLDLSDAEQLDSGELSKLITRVWRRHQASSLLLRLPFGDNSNELILGPGKGISSTGAVLLAFHAGAGLNVETLAAALGTSKRFAGQELYDARMAVIGNDVAGCSQFQSAAGRYADASLPQGSLVAFVNHSRACGECSQVLDEFRALDERIAEAVSQADPVQPAASDERARLSGNPFLLLAPIGALVLAAIAVLAILGFGSASQSGSAPLFAASEPAEHRGWLIAATEHEIMALDLESGERRRILEGPAHDWWNPWIVSPNAELAVRWDEFTRGEVRIGAIRAYDMQGERQFLHRWRGPRSRTFSGWLDDRTVLFAERGPIARVGVTSEIPDDMAPSLIAANLDTGEERVIYRGLIDKAIPAPDGQHFAIIRPAPSPWPAKTVDIMEIGDNGADVVASLEHRHLSWPGRLVWSTDSQAIFFPLIPEADLPDRLPGAGGSAPGIYEFERLGIAGLAIDGTVSEFEAGSGSRWLVPQAVDPDGETLSVVVNESMDRDGDWFHGSLDLHSGELSQQDSMVPGSRWWNTESIWSPKGDQMLHQQVIRDRFRETADDEITPATLVLRSDSATPTMVFQDSTSLQLRSGTGLGLLRWVPDDVMRSEEEEPPDRPNPGEPQALSQATSDQQLMADSSVASTGRYVLLRQHDPGAGSRDRLMHLQAWGGTQSELFGTRDFSWLPREPAVIGASQADRDNGTGSRLVFVGTDQISPLHGFEIDPAGLGNSEDLAYRMPVFSQNGANLAFFIEDQESNRIELWLDTWNSDPVEVTSWTRDDEARLDHSLTLNWISDDALIFTRVSSWDDGYPREVEFVRVDLDENGDAELTVVREFSTRGSDRGIDLVDFALGPDATRIAIRLRSFTGSDPDADARDAILVSSVADLTQSIEIIRTDPGEGISWLRGDDWLVAGVDGRIALLEATGREVGYLTDSPSEYPVLIGPSEIWYQDKTGDGRIMRVTFD